MQSQPRLQMGGGVTGGVTPTSESRKIEVHKQRRTPKVALPTAEVPVMSAAPVGRGRGSPPPSTPSPSRVRDVTGGRRKALALPLPPPTPNVPPLAVDVTTCRQRTAMFCWLCRQGEEGKVDTAFSSPRSAVARHGRRVSPLKSRCVAADTKHPTSNLAEAFKRARRCRRRAGAGKVHAARQVKIFSGFPECGYSGASLKAGRSESEKKKTTRSLELRRGEETLV